MCPSCMSRYLQASAFIKSDINVYKQCNILLLGLCYCVTG